MKKQKFNAALFGIIFFIALLLLDRATKIAAVTFLKGCDPVIIVKNVFQLSYLENRGAAFGILQGKQFFFIFITVFVLVCLVYIYMRMPSTKRFLSLRVIIIMLASGAVGNFIDRITQGYVVDFFYFNLINFPIFNVADIYVTVSLVLLIILVIFFYRENDINAFVKSLRLRNED